MGESVLLFSYMKWSLLLVLFLLPTIAFGQEGFVQCGYERMCNVCDLVLMVNNIITWMFGILALLAVMGLMVAGFRLVVSGGDVGAWTSAKQMFTNIIVGFVIVLAAWLIVDTIMKALLDPNLADSQGVAFGMWNQLDGVNCGGAMVGPGG